jgi:hypothetical protein
LIVARLADAVQEGLALRKETMPTEAAEAEGALEADDKYLSEGTLAKLRAGLGLEGGSDLLEEVEVEEE